MADNTLDYISVQGFRSIQDAKLDLRDINILVGANGSGKSNVIGVFAFLNAIRQGRLRTYTQQKGGANNILFFGSKITEAIKLEVSFVNSANGYQISLAATELDELYVQEEHCWFWLKERYPQPKFQSFLPGLVEAAISQEREQQDIATWVQIRLDSWRIYHFHDTSDRSPMKRIADIDDNQYLRPDGSNLPAYLLLLKEQYLPSYQLIRNAVRKVTPFLDDFQLLPLRRNEDKIRLHWLHRSSDRYFDVSSLSDGTLRFIGLATLLLQPVELRPSIILIDEPELGLHPYAIAMLANAIKFAATETQVILTTQSPLLLDHFEPEHILVTELDKGATKIFRLNPGELDVWLEDYSLGQLWEKNQFGGRPKHG